MDCSTKAYPSIHNTVQASVSLCHHQPLVCFAVTPPGLETHKDRGRDA
ncbi:hypothetical protein LEMLEM_LOCUS12683 [Lemmus lemmus]